MATNAEVITNMMDRLGSRSALVLRGKVLYELNEKIRQYDSAALLPWFNESRITGNFVAAQDYIAVPSNFVREVEEGEFKVKTLDGVWKKIFKVSLEKLEAETENAIPAFPEGYAIYGDRFYFGPIPDAAYEYKFPVYIRTNVILDNNSAVTNPWLLEFYNLMTFETLDIVARVHVQSDELANKFRQPLAEARDSFVRTVEARKHANMDYLLTDSET